MQIIKYNNTDITNEFMAGRWAHPETGVKYPRDWDASTIEGVTVETVEPEPIPPSPLEQLLAQAEAVRQALVDAVQARFQSVQDDIGAFFQSSAEFKTFAGFTNAFQLPAQQFGAWEAEVWHQANIYKLQVMQGQAPMLTPEQAVEMMPSYPLGN